MLVIFDCDGVLIDSEILAARVWNRELARFDLDVPVEDLIAHFTGKTDRDMAKHFLAQFANHTPALPSDLADHIANVMAVTMEQELEVIPDVITTLADLPFERCVCSNSRKKRLFKSLEQVGLITYFGLDHIYSAEDVTNPKPAPDLYLHAAKTLGYAPADCLVIEDSVTGVKAAVAAGMRVIGFTGASHVQPAQFMDLLDAGAQQIFSSMEQLPEVIDKVA